MSSSRSSCHSDLINHFVHMILCNSPLSCWDQLEVHKDSEMKYTRNTVRILKTNTQEIQYLLLELS